MARWSRVPVLSSVGPPAPAAPSALLERVRAALPGQAWEDGDMDISDSRDGVTLSRRAGVRACVYGPETSGVEARVLAERACAAGLLADAVVVREGEYDSESGEYGPRVWRVRITEVA